MKNFRLPRMSIFNKLLLITLTSIFVVFTFMIVLVTNIMLAHSVAAEKALNKENAECIMNSIKGDLNEAVHILSFAQQSLSMIDYNSNMMKATVDKILLRMLELNPKMFRVWFFTPDIYYKGNKFAAAYLRQNNVTREFQNFEGRLKYSENNSRYFKALKTGKIYFDNGEFYDYGIEYGTKYSAAISIPIIVNGKTIGVCGIDLVYKDMFEEARKFHKMHGQAVMILDENMTILYSLDPALIDKNFADFKFEDTEDLRNAIGQKISYSGEIMSQFLNAKALVSMHPIPIDIGERHHNLYLYIGLPLKILRANVYNIVFWIITASLVSMFLISGIIFINTKKALQHIIELTRYAQQIATTYFNTDSNATNYPMPPPHPYDDMHDKSEVATLRRVFVKMLDVLNDNMATVEKRVVDRTRELLKLNNYIALLMESSSDIFLLLDREINITYCSNKILPLLGFNNLDEIVGNPLRVLHMRISDKAYVARSRGRISDVVLGKDGFSEDETIIWPNGESRSYRIVYRRLIDHDNNLDGIVIVMRDFTDVRLEEAQMRMNDVLYSTQLPCMMWDDNGNVVAYNNEILRIFDFAENLPPEENNKILSDILPEYQPNGKVTEVARQEFLRDVLDKGFSRVNVVLHKTYGRPIYFLISAARISWLNGYRLVLYFNDLTDIRIKERQAREAEERVKLMLDATPLCCDLWDENIKIIDCNKEALKLFDMPDKQAYMDNFSRLSPKRQPDGELSSVKFAKYTEEGFRKGRLVFEWVYKKLTGEFIPSEVTFVRIKHGEYYIMASYTRDLREYKKIMAATNEANERIKLMLDATPLCCTLWDENIEVIDCNEEAVKLFGMPDKQTYMDNFHRLSPEYQPNGELSLIKVPEFINEAFEKGRLVFEWMHQTINGEPVPMEVTLVRIKRRNSYILASYMRDLREAKAHEQKIQESMEQSRILELQKIEAQTASEAKSQFLANMSHEIRTPMNAVLGMTELLLAEKLNKRQLQYARDIKTSTIALLEIINDILDISKIQAGKLNLVSIHYDFKALMDNIYSIAHFLAGDKNVLFKLIVQEDVPRYLYGDDVRLKQVLLNILNNAFKFTEEGYVSLSINATDADINFTISDTGIGIRAEDISLLFQVFEQFDTVRNRDKKGFGLGMTIVKSLIEMMDGQITVESIYGEGTSFHVTIPKILGDETLIHYGDDNEGAVYAPDAKILVVDDNTVNLNVASGLLRLNKITAETAASGQKAIDLVSQKQYDIVFMDHRMPEMDGAEATQIIREMGIKTPIIALTADAVAGVKEALLKSGMDDFLSKPIIKSALNSMLRKWIPVEKIVSADEANVAGESDAEKHEEFWKKIEQIEGLSISIGLERVADQRDIYESSLKLTINEIEKCIKNLNNFLAAEDMPNFCIEAHGMKGSLANIGVMELSDKARELELASDKGDTAFCVFNLPDFIEKLDDLSSKLKEAFKEKKQSHGPIEIPAELPPLFKRLKNAFDKMDFVAIDNEMEKMDALNLSGALKEEIELIKDAVLGMDYEDAELVMQKLLNNE